MVEGQLLGSGRVRRGDVDDSQRQFLGPSSINVASGICEWSFPMLRSIAISQMLAALCQRPVA
jgi:hypothetical protein